MNNIPRNLIEFPFEHTKEGREQARLALQGWDGPAMTLSDSDFSRVAEKFREDAGEDLRVEFCDGSFYLFGSERAVSNLMSQQPSAVASGRMSRYYSYAQESHYVKLAAPEINGFLQNS